MGWDDGFRLPTDPGPIHKRLLRICYWIEDRWRFLAPMDKATVAFVLFALVLWVAIALFCVPGPR